MITEKKKILPITYPPITTYPGFAATLSILYSHEESYDWMYSHYLQIYAIDKANRDEYTLPLGGAPYMVVFFGDTDNRRLTNTNSDFMFFSKEKCQYLDSFEVPTEFFIASNEPFISFLKRSIDLDMYMYLYVDQSNIEMFHRDSGFVHPLFIFGYDDKNSEVHVADFVNGKFAYFQCSYDELEKAFYSAMTLPNNANNMLPKESDAIALIRYINYAPFTFDYSYIQDTIYEYIYPDETKTERFNNYTMSRHSFRKRTLKTYSGVDVYNYLSDLIELERNAGRDYVDYRIYHAMYDHKEMMIKRLEYFFQQGYLGSDKSAFLEAYNEVRDNTLSIRNSILKYNIKKDKGITDKVVIKLDETKRLEISLLKGLFDIH